MYYLLIYFINLFSEVKSFMTRMSQSIDTQEAKIAELQAEIDRLRELNENDGKEQLSVLKCGICLEIKKADDFSINTPCGHCFCKTVSL
jgi:hypothetical protein